MRLEPRLWRTASFRLAALYLLLFVASTALLAAVVFWIARGALVREMRARIMAESASLTAEFRAGGTERLVATVRLLEQGAGALEYRVQAADGARLAGRLPVLPVAHGWITLRPSGSAADGENQQEGQQGEAVRALVTPLGAGLRLAVGEDLDRIEDVQTAILIAFAWALGLVVVLGGAGGLVLSRGFLRRVDAIGRTAQAIIDGDVSQRIPLRGSGDDLDRLAGTLNRMLDRITALMESLRQVSSDVAHDLRTPLTRLMQALETARTEATTVAEFRAAVDAAAAETEAILRTFAAILRIAQVEGGGSRASLHLVNLSALAETVAEAFAPSIEAAGHHFLVNIDSEVTVRGDAELLTQLTVNLVENALNHTPAGTAILLRVERGPRGAVLTIADNGPGVPEAERARIFERFYRAERSRSTPGSGLGLALVAAVAGLHGAGLSADDAAPGLAVVVTFPPPG